MKSKSLKMIIIVGSKHGSTYDISDRLCFALNKEGLETVIAYPEDIKTFAGYDIVSLGSAVYMGRWLKSMRQFVDKFADELQTKKCYLFSSGQVGKPLKPEYDKAVNVDGILHKTKAKEHVLFAGKLDKSKLGFRERAITKMLKMPGGDYRDLKEIDRWAKHVATQVRED